MVLILILSGIFAFLISVCISFLLIKITKLTEEKRKLLEYIKFATDKINQARYGNFQVQFNNKKDEPGLYKSLDNLFESITDRDLVINEYREKEKENYNLKEEFIAALTHDLKVPIIAQDKTYDLFLQNKFDTLTPIQKEVVQKLKESNTELKEMVNSILETYKIENTGIELKIEKEIEVEEFLNTCIEGFKNFEHSTSKEIKLNSNAKNLKADFDKFLIKRAVNNLILNAINHSNTKDRIDIFLNKNEDTFSIDVVDYGDGIDEEEIQKIFKKYYNGRNRTNKISTGLGLYLSNKIIKKHKGSIEVKSKKGEGSVFRIILPIKSKDYTIKPIKGI